MRPAVVIDVGTDSVRAGLARQEKPSVVFKSVVGKPKKEKNVEAKDSFVGEAALEGGEDLALSNPLQRGVVLDWKAMEAIWHHTFHTHLHINPEEHPVLLTETPSSPERDREIAAEILFEKFDVPSLLFSLPSVLSMYATGATEGMVVMSGEGATHAVPVRDGRAIRHAIRSSHVGGEDLTSYLHTRLREQGKLGEGDEQMARLIKESACHVSLRYHSDLKKCKETKEFELPDGRVVDVGQERFICPEALFEPQSIGLSGDGVQKLVYDSLTQCELNTRLWRNVHLAGGNTLFPGVMDRLQDELDVEVVPGTEVNIRALPDRKYLPWIGGAVMGQLPTFNKFLVDRDEYAESGPTYLHEKCNR